MPHRELPRLEHSWVSPAAANDATVGILMLDTDQASIQIFITESSARDLAYELAVFLGDED